MTWNTFSPYRVHGNESKPVEDEMEEKNPSVGLDGVTYKIFDQNQKYRN